MDYRLLIAANEDFEEFLTVQKLLTNNSINELVTSKVKEMLSLLVKPYPVPPHFDLYVRVSSENEIEFRRKVAGIELDGVINGKSDSLTSIMKYIFYYIVSSDDKKPFFFCSPAIEINTVIFHNNDSNLLKSFNRLRENNEYFMITDNEQELYSNQIVRGGYAASFINEIVKLKDKKQEFRELANMLPQSSYLLIIQQLIF